jgi:hypothetical protein
MSLVAPKPWRRRRAADIDRRSVGVLARSKADNRGVAGECELRGEELVGRSLPRRPDIWAAQQRSPTKFCFGLRALDFTLFM